MKNKLKIIFSRLEKWADRQLRRMIESRYTFWFLLLYFLADVVTWFVDFEIIFGNIL